MESQQKRLLIALALAFALTAVYTIVSPKPPSEAADGGVETAVELADAGVGQPRIETAPTAQVAQGDGGVAAAQPSGQKTAEVRTLERIKPQIHYGITTRAAGLVKAELQGPKMREQRPVSAREAYRLLFGGEVPDAPQMDMASPADL